MAQKITVRNNQSLLDIAVQEAGTIMAVLDIMKQNNMSITDDLLPGEVLTLDSPESIETDIKNYYKANGLRPSSAVQLPEELQPLDGIDYWAIQDNFTVE